MMSQIISFAEHRDNAYVDGRAEVHLQHARTQYGTTCYPLSQFVVFGYENQAEENEILTYKGPEYIRVDALKALLGSFDPSRMSEAERECISRNAESLKRVFNEFIVRVQVW